MLNKHELIRIWRGFWQLADPKIWIASTVPMAVGVSMAYGIEGAFNLHWLIAAVLSVYLIEIAKNAINEVIDYQSGVDRFVTPNKRTPFSGGKKTIIDGLLTIREAIVIAILTLGIASLIGLYIIFVRESSVLWIGLAGIFFAVFYSLPPLKLSYRGIGEFVVGITFGPLILSGMYIIQTHTINLEVIIASLPIGFLIANILWINQYPDYEADTRGKKMNWLVRLGKKRGLRVYTFLFIGAYIFIFLLYLISNNPFWLLSFLSLPIVVHSVKTARNYYNCIPKLIQANAKTIQIYQLIGLTMVFAPLLHRFLL